MTCIDHMVDKPDLDTVPSPKKVGDSLERLLNEEYTKLLFAGLRYPARSKSVEQLILGGLFIFPFIITTIPILGNLIENVQNYVFPATGYSEELENNPSNSIDREYSLYDLPRYNQLNRWFQLYIIGTKGVIISMLCIISPFAIISSYLGAPFGAPISNSLESRLAGYTIIVGAIVLLYFYPAVLGNFIETGNLRQSLKTVNDAGNLTSSTYRRGVAVVITIVGGGALLFWLLYNLLGIVAFVFLGPVTFYCLLSTHYVIGEVRRQIKTNESGNNATPTYISPSLTDRNNISQSKPSLLVNLLHLLRPTQEDDPVATKYKDQSNIDLYEVSTWHEKSRLDRIASRLYRNLTTNHTWWILLFVISGSLIQISYWIRETSTIGRGIILIFASMIPALLLVIVIISIYHIGKIPVRGFIGAFLLSAAATPWIWISYTLFMPLRTSGFIGVALFAYFPNAIGVLGILLFVLLIFTYRSKINSVMDGAIYGTIIGLGYIFLENINNVLSHETALAMSFSAAVEQRGMIGPTAVIFMAILGYYVGLARFNTQQAGPIIVKGFLISVFLRGTFDTLWHLVRVITINHQISIEQSTLYILLSNILPDFLWSESVIVNSNRIFLVISTGVLLLILIFILNRYRYYINKDTEGDEEEMRTSPDSSLKDESKREYIESARLLLKGGMISPEEFETITKRL